MPIIRGNLVGGESIEFYVPVGTKEEDLPLYGEIALEKRARGEDPTKPPETTLGGYAKEAGKGILSGAAGLLESAATGAAFLLPEEQEQAARKAIAEYGADVQADLAPRGGYEDTVVRKLAEATGSTVPFLATGFLGAPGLAAGVATGAAAGAGEAARRAEAAGATEEQISEAAGLGVLPGLGETLVPFAIGKTVKAVRVARGLEKAIGQEATQTALTRLRRVASAAGGEGLQEASAEIAQNLISQGVYDPETGTFAGTGESLGYGAGVGGLLAALGELAIPGRRRLTPQAQEQLKTIEGESGQMDMFPAELVGEVQVPRPTTPAEEDTGDIESGAVSDLSQFDLFDTRRGQKPISPRSLPIRAPERIVGTPEGELILPGQEAEARQRAIETRERAVAERRQAVEAARAAEGLPPGQLEMFPTEPVESPESKRLNNLPIIKRLRSSGALRMKNLAQPEWRQEVITKLEGWLKRTRKTETPETRKAVAGLLTAVRELDTTTPITDTDAQLDIEQQIDRDVVAEQARTAEQEREAGFERAEQEREQARLDRTAAFEEAEAAREDQRAAEEVMARSEQEFASQPTATALAMQEAERRGRAVPGQQQLEVPAIPPADATIQELRNVEQRISRGQVQEPSTEGQITEQGDLIGPRGGPRTRMPAAETTQAQAEQVQEEPTETAVKNKKKRKSRTPGAIEQDTLKIRKLSDKHPAAQFLKDKPPAKGIIDLANDIVENGYTKDNQAAMDWVQNNLSGKAFDRLITRIEKGLESDGLNLPVDAIAETDTAVSAETMEALQRGDLRGALETMLVGADKTLTRVIRAVMDNIGATRVVMQNGVTNYAGKEVLGVFSPRTNTITLNTNQSVYGHTILHEALHAVTSAELAKNTPAARQMRNLYEAVRGRLDTAYGATSLDEFVAEVFSNPEFRAKLARFNSNGEPISFLQKFKNIVQNIINRFRGLPSKKAGNALSDVDKLIESLMAPAPEYRDAADMFSDTIDGTYKQTLNSLGRLVKDKGNITDADIASVYGFLNAATRKARKLAYSFLPLDAVRRIASGYFPNVAEKANELFKLIERKNGARNNALERVQDTLAEIRDALKDKTAAQAVLDDIVAESTLARVDPTKPRTTYKDKASLESWDAMNAKINALSPAEKKALLKAYTTLRDSYSKVYKDMIETLKQRIDAIEMDPNARKGIRDRLLERLTKDSIEPYFPLYRKGQYWLTYTATDPRTGGTEFYKELFESEAQRAKAKALLPKEATNIAEFDKSNTSAARELGVDARWGYGVLEQLRVAGADQKSQDIVLDALLDVMPERSALNAFRAREGVLGFERNALKVASERLPTFVTQKVNLEYDLPLTQSSNDIQEAVNEYTGTDEQDHAVDLNEVFQGYIKFARNPQLSSWSRMLKSAGFGMTLGLNVSSVLVNATNVPVVVLPYLGGKFGFRKTSKALGRAAKLFASTYGTRTRQLLTGEAGSETRAGPSLTNLDFNDPNSVPEELRQYKALAEMLEARGQANRSMTQDILELKSTDASWWQKTNAVMGFVFHQGERANRQITAMAAYDLYLQENVKGTPTQEDMQAAAEYAIETTELTNSGAMTETAPRIAQSNMGSWMMMYKRFGISMLFLQARMARQALKGIKDTGERKQAVKQIAGLFASSAMFAGIQGLPLYGVLSFIMNSVFLDDEDEDFDSMVASFFGEGMYSGPVNAITGADIAPRVGMTNLVFRSLPNKEQESLILQGLEFFGGPVFGIASRMEGGIQLISEGEVYRGMERLLPAAFSNAMKAGRYATQGATTLRGDPIVEDLNAWNIFAQMLGLAPAGYTQVMELNAKDKRIDRALAEKKTKLFRRFHLARRTGDTDEMRDVLEEIAEYNRDNPEVAVTAQSFARSMDQHRITDEITRQLGGITVNRRRLAKLAQERRELLD